MISILICDDNADVRAAVADLVEAEPDLRLLGVTASGRELIAKASENEPQVIILDLAMADGNGLDTLAELAIAAPGARTVIFSAYGAQAIKEVALQSGAAAYVEKGADIAELLSAIRSCAASRGPDVGG